MKTGQKILIASGGLLLAGGIAYAASPRFRNAVQGIIPAFSLKGKIQKEISKIIATRSFLDEIFIEAAYKSDLLQANEKAREDIFKRAVFNLQETPVGLTYVDFNYSALAEINNYFITHVRIQRQIDRVMSGVDGWDHWLDMTVNRPGTDMNEARGDIFNAALDDTDSDSSYAGGNRDYFYTWPVLLLQGVSKMSWYNNFFRNGFVNSNSYSGGSGNGSGSNSGAGSSGGNNAGGGINVGFEDVWNAVQDFYCETFGCDQPGTDGMPTWEDPCGGGQMIDGLCVGP